MGHKFYCFLMIKALHWKYLAKQYLGLSKILTVNFGDPPEPPNLESKYDPIAASKAMNAALYGEKNETV